MTTTKIITASNSFAFWSILDCEKLNGANFLDWYRNRRIVLTQDKKLYVLEGPIPDCPPSNASKERKEAWATQLVFVHLFFHFLPCFYYIPDNILISVKHFDLYSEIAHNLT